MSRIKLIVFQVKCFNFQTLEYNVFLMRRQGLEKRMAMWVHKCLLGNNKLPVVSRLTENNHETSRILVEVLPP